MNVYSLSYYMYWRVLCRHSVDNILYIYSDRGFSEIALIQFGANKVDLLLPLPGKQLYGYSSGTQLS